MPQQATYTNARWETKAIVKNPREGRTNSLKIDILGIRNAKMRLEISALFGTQVASLVMSPSDISYIYYAQKKFYSGRNSERAFAGLLDLPLHPMNLSYIVFDQPLVGPGWHCQNDSAGWISLCKNLEKAIEVKWLSRTEDGEKRVLITAPNFEMSWSFQAPQTSVQFKTEVFTLSQPEGFKAIQIH